MNWKLFANCRDSNPAVFYPEHGARAQQAKAMCRACAVRADCLEFALATGDRHGIWGGLSEDERRPIRGARLREQRAAS